MDLPSSSRPPSSAAVAADAGREAVATAAAVAVHPSSSPGALFLDLTLGPYAYISPPKLEPKLEPLDEEEEERTNAALNPNFAPKSEDPENDEPLPLLSLSPRSANEHLFSQLYGLRRQQQQQQQLRRHNDPSSATALPAALSTSGDLVVAGNGDAGLGADSWSLVPGQGGASSEVVASARRRRTQQRSGEMVRVSAIDPRDQRYFRDLVRRTRTTYETLRALLLKGEESGGPLPPMGRRNRADLNAATLMRVRGLWLNRDKRIIGSIPGVQVGDVFFYRMELCIIGLHGHIQAGIDYVSASQSSSREPIATSIIVSGGYEDDEDTGNVIIYTGHGGKERHAARQVVNQKLEAGNLALERSMQYGIEIRVIRGFKYDESPSARVYVYDGLYRIVEHWQDMGKSGFLVYKYKLVRIADQEEMGSTILKHAEELKDQLLLKKVPVGYLCHDMSMGRENVPVTLFNDIDDDQYPMLFEYVARPVYPPSMVLQRANLNGGGGCQCVTSCTENCSCLEKNGGDFAYDANGILLMGKPLIYECGSWCRCPPTCRNRVSQKGVRNRLEVFRSMETGWGVRSLDLIRAGSFICEYSGIVLTKQQAEVLSMDGDSLVCPSRFPNRWYEWGDISNIVPEYPRPMFPPLPQLNFSIDVSRTRNVACYLSQSYSPNVFLQFVLYDHYDASYPHLMIFAMENIPPLRELSIDYGVEDAVVANLSPE